MLFGNEAHEEITLVYTVNTAKKSTLFFPAKDAELARRLSRLSNTEFLSSSFTNVNIRPRHLGQ